MRRVLPILGLVAGCASSAPPSPPAAAAGPPVQLEVRGTVRYAMTPEWPVRVELTAGLGGEAVASTEVHEDGGAWELRAPVGPGDWMVQAIPPSEKTHWRAFGEGHHVSPTGEITCSVGCGRTELVIVGLMTGLSPSGRERVAVPMPTLSWDAVQDASFYRIRWFERDGTEVVATEQGIDVQGTSWTFSDPVNTNRLYEWHVEARAGGRSIAQSNAWFATPGFEPSEPAEVEGGGWLGLQVITTSSSEAELMPVEEGLSVLQVIPNSPAAAADFRQRDRIVSVDGEAVETVAEFVARVRALEPGVEVAIAIERDDREMVVVATIGER